jgi:phthiodiolone/phenolphthiodiolone dimycocerosates ketoreductase
MRESTLNGTPDEVIDQPANYRDQGLRYLVGVLQPSLRKGIASNLAFAKIIRGLKKTVNARWLLSHRPIPPER